MLDFLIGLYEGIGVLLGLGSPWKRFFLGGIAGFALQLIIKPSVSYNSDGSAKKLGETLFPWYAWVIVPSLVFALFL